MASRVAGTVVIPESAPAGVLHVRVERVDRADAAAGIVASTSIAIAAAPRAHSVSFELIVATPDPKGRYTVRAHLALSNRKGVQRGDYVSTISYPVLTRSSGQRVAIALSPTD